MAKPTKEMKTLALSVFLKNQEMNDAKREHDKARKLLFNLMEAAGTKALTYSSRDEHGNPVAVTATIQTPSVTHISIDLLKRHVDEETFLKIVTATKTAVEQHAGELVAMKCEIVEPGTQNVFVHGVRGHK